jgi:hypothetical protein
MSALNFSDAQIFFLAFLLLSLPIFALLSFRGAFTGIKITKLRVAGERFPARLPVTATETPGRDVSPREAGSPRDRVPSCGKNLETFQISVSTPDWVPSNHDFTIAAKIESLSDKNAPSAGAFGPLAVKIKPGTTLTLILDCMSMPDGIGPAKRPVTVYAPRQAASCGSQPVTAVFAARSKRTESAVEANMRLWLLADGVEIGAIDFEIAVSSEATATAQNSKSGKAPTLTRAALFKRALIWSNTQDRRKIAEYIPAVDAHSANNIEYRIANLSEKPQAGLDTPLSGSLQEADLVYIFWSSAAASSPDTHNQLELIKAERMRRKYQSKPGQRKQLGICVVKLDNCLIEPPNWLYYDGGYFKNAGSASV